MEENDQKKVSAALTLDVLSLHHRIQFRPSEARDFLKLTPVVYAVDLDKMVADIDHVIPTKQYGKGNPSNGQTHHHYLIGRENSRVIYVDIIGAYLEGDKAAMIAHIVKSIKEIANNYNSDEFTATVDEDHSAMIRIWWD